MTQFARVEEEDVLPPDLELRNLGHDHLLAVVGDAAREEELEASPARLTADLADRLDHVVREDRRVLGVPLRIRIHDDDFHRGIGKLGELPERHVANHRERRGGDQHRREGEQDETRGSALR